MSENIRKFWKVSKGSDRKDWERLKKEIFENLAIMIYQMFVKQLLSRVKNIKNDKEGRTRTWLGGLIPSLVQKFGKEFVLGPQLNPVTRQQTLGKYHRGFGENE